MASRNGFAHEMRKAFGKIADEETRRRRSVFRQKFEQHAQVLFDPAFQLVPLRRRRLEAGSREIEPVLYIDGKDTLWHSRIP